MGRARPVASDPDPDPNPTDPNGAESHQLRLVAMREHSLLSLFELSQELSVVLDTAGLADLALFNLMGHLGTSQAVLLLESGSRPGCRRPWRK